MLNKNQSNKRNSLKYALVLPVLAAFVIFFQVKVIAQEKLQEKREITNTGNVTFVDINKNSTDEEMKKDAEIIKKQHGIILKFSKIKRNSNGEITAIKVEYKDKNGSNGVTQIAGKEPIKPIHFYKSVDMIGFGSSKEMKNFNQKKDSNTIEEQDLEFSFNDDVVDIDAPEPPKPPTPPNFPEVTLPDAPAPDMSKMPAPPKPPTNANNKKAMAKFEKEMAEFEKKMDAFEPDMKAYEEKIEKEMTKHEVVFEKEMEKFEEKMKVFETEMEIYQKKIHEPKAKKEQK